MPRTGPLGEAMKAKLRQTQSALASELQQTRETLRAAQGEIRGKDTALLSAQQQLQAATSALEAGRARELEVNAQCRVLAQHTVALRSELGSAEAAKAKMEELQAREAELNQEVREAQARLQVALFDADNANQNRRSLEAKLEDVVHDYDTTRRDHSVELAARSVELRETETRLEATLQAMEAMRIGEAELRAQQQEVLEREATLHAELEAERRAKANPRGGARSKSASRHKSKRKASKGAKRRFQNPLSLWRGQNEIQVSSSCTRSSSSQWKRSPRQGLVDDVLGEDHELGEDHDCCDDHTEMNAEQEEAGCAGEVSATTTAAGLTCDE
mmetsp:Transcript_51063/g.143742  ORF Transcript_51063/g.143742 Transcript_51063/m.143742 type:complete len:330 (+) Transcript_51063:65-1054(+)